MTDIVRHRGPDGDGFYYHKNVGFGHRRLAIIDLSTDGAQPMDWEADYTITFNGEIYNYIEIRNTLKQKGYTFKTKSDTEVILAAYDFWGSKCVLEFNGMWAFAIHDKKSNIVFCSRDRFGVKPFYYCNGAENFAFGSEVKQLLPFLSEVKANINLVVNYLVLNLSDYDQNTFFDGIFKLLGGHNLTYSIETNDFTIERYYEIAFKGDVHKLDEAEAIERLTHDFDRSIKYRLRSDVKVGTCLSGGLDSSAIAAVANKLHRQESNAPFCAITASSTDPKVDEYGYAKMVVDHLGLESHVTKPTKKDFLAYLDKVIHTQEYPFIGPTVFMQYFVMQKAKEAGITVLLDGQGADEALLGYQRYIPTLMYSKGLFFMLTKIFSLHDHYNISFADLFKNIAYFTNPKVRLFRQKRDFFSLKKEHHSLLNKQLYQKYSDAYSDVFELQKLEFTESQIPQLLRFEDKNSMAHSIESRLPFMDWEFVETALSINTNFKLKDGWSKYVLRKSVEDKLPEKIVWRTDKIGFNAPLEDWLDPTMVAVMTAQIEESEILKHLFSEIPKNLNKHQLWRLFSVAKWEKIFSIKI